ncbi:serine/threonine-protein kinase [Streptomyces spiralis]|uniref:serine/threonine-protein kinase n=1 Tax=Streptomyces spiralis TaxID=66376 RepID=UPI0033BFF561
MEKLGPGDPQRIGVYRLLARLGAGGMGQVYLARSDRGRTVAVKLVRQELAQQEEFRARFRQEVRAARRVGGHWTAPVLDADTEAAVPWVATGYVAGPSLQQVVGHDHGALPERSVRILAAGLAGALKDIHAAGLIHRDLKPSNVLVTIDGPRVIDFGIARALETVTDGGLTRTGALVGSPGFMAPEQVRGDRVTTAADVFCLGSVLAYAATGALPFGTADSGVHALMYRIAEQEPDLQALPEGIADLVRACLKKDPAVRPTLDWILDRTGAEDTLADGRFRDPWLPSALVAQLGRHAVQLLEAENPEEREPQGAPEGTADAVTPAGPGAAGPADLAGAAGPVAGSVGPVAGEGGRPELTKGVQAGPPGAAADSGESGSPGAGAAADAGPVAEADDDGAGAEAVPSAGAGADAGAAGTAYAAAAGDPPVPGPAAPGSPAAPAVPAAAAGTPAAPAADGTPAVPGAAAGTPAAPGAVVGTPPAPTPQDPAAVRPAPTEPSVAQPPAEAPRPSAGHAPAAPGATPPVPGQPGGGGAQPPVNHLPTMVAGQTPPPGPAPVHPGYGYPQQPAPGLYGYPQQPGGWAPAGAHNPYSGLGATPPYGPPPVGSTPPYGPNPLPAQHEPRRGGRSTAALVAMALVVALVAGGSVYALMRSGGGDHDDKGGPGPSPAVTAPTTPADSTDPGQSPTTSPPDSPSPSDGVVPAAYLGTWTTTIDNAYGANPRRLTISQGDVGDTVLTLVADGPLQGGGTYHCVFRADLTRKPVDGGPLEIGPSSLTVGQGTQGCSPGAATQVSLLSDGSLRRVNTTTGEQLTYTKE